MKKPGEMQFSLTPSDPMYVLHQLETLRNWAMHSPEAAAEVIKAMTGGMVQACAHAYMRGMNSQQPQAQQFSAQRSPVRTSQHPMAHRAPNGTIPPNRVRKIARTQPPSSPMVDFKVGDRVRHQWLGEGLVTRIFWRDNHWHVTTDGFGAPASSLVHHGNATD